MPRNLLVAGGIFHPFDETVPALVAIGREAGIETVAMHDVEAGLRSLSEGFDLLTVHCLRWTMTQHEKYAPYRAEWAFSPSAEARAAVEDHVRRGGGLLGVHAAPISFDDWPEWGALLGVRWVWGRSHHPPQGPVEVRIDDGGHPVTAGLAGFSATDELYSELDLDPEARILAYARAGEGWQPVAVVKEAHDGRQAYLALGHDGASMAVPGHRALIGRALRWCAGLPEGGAS